MSQMNNDRFDPFRQDEDRNNGEGKQEQNSGTGYDPFASARGNFYGPDYFSGTYQPWGAATTPNKPNGFALAALFCGIGGIALSSTFVMGCLLGILGIVFARLSKRDLASMPGKARAGMICGIVAIAVSVLSLVIAILLGPWIEEFLSTLEDYSDALDDAYDYASRVFWQIKSWLR